MLATGITWLTTLAMLLHGSVGCCWHHAHGDDETRAACACEVVVESVADESRCAGHSHTQACGSHATPAPPSDVIAAVADCGCRRSDRHGAGCSEAECSFLKHRSVELPDLLSVADAGPVDVPAALPDASRLLGAERTADRHPPPAAAVRRALTQVWLL
jgi:hypothetical protein